MTEVTAQPIEAAETDPNAQLANAAEAFKAFDNPAVAQPRDDQGRWTGEEAPEEEDAEPEPTEEVVEEGEAPDEEEEAPEQGQPMPPSWPADQAEQWSQLPAETQAFLANREAERERAVNAKFQESANVRKAAEAEYAEATTSRQQYTEALEMLMVAMQPAEPDPRDFGAGTGQYDREGYDLAVAQARAQAGVYTQLQEQWNAQNAQAIEEDNARLTEWKASHESQWAPKFVEEVPALNDPVQAQGIISGLVQYGVENGLERYFAPENHAQITSDVLRLLWKSQEYDKLKATAKTVAPKPKPAGPAVKPGVSSPRSAQKAMRMKQADERLTREGSLEAAAAMFKQMF